jgi:hypothetical protein
VDGLVDFVVVVFGITDELRFKVEDAHDCLLLLLLLLLLIDVIRGLDDQSLSITREKVKLTSDDRL